MTQSRDSPQALPDCCVPAGVEVGVGDTVGDVQTRLQAALGTAYRIDRELRGGGQSRVFAAVETSLERHVAIKVLPPDLTAAINVERFHRETPLVANLQHPHIVPLLTAGTAGGLLYYTMPLVDGESLRERIAREGPLPIADVIRILLEIADALAYASSHGVLHRDIKPGNVLLAAGHALVTDFGVAKAVAASGAGRPERPTLTELGVALGTPAYMAPEQGAADEHTDHRADIYALGVVGYEMLTGQPPFTGTVSQILLAHATQPPVPLSQRRPDVTEPLAALITQCLEKEPGSRPQTAGDVRDALDSMLTSRSGAPARVVAPLSHARRRSRVLLVAGSITVAALGSTFAYRAYSSRADLDPHRVIVAAFQNRSHDPTLDQLTTMAVDWIMRGMTEAGVADAVPATLKRDASGKVVPEDLEPVALARQARLLGGQRIVSGAFYVTGDSLQFHAQIIDAADGTILVSVPPATAPRGEPMTAINAVRTSVLGALAAMSPSEGFGIVSSETPPSYAAYREFLSGEEAFSRGGLQEAIDHDTRAIALDSTYLAPLVRMAYAFVNLGQCARTDSLGALLNTKRERLPAYEGYYLDRALAWCRGDMDAAYIAAKRMAAVSPHSTYAKYISARAAIPINHPREAVETLERLGWKKPHISGYYADLAGALHQLGRHERELEVAQLYRQRYAGSLRPAEALVRALSALGRVDEVRRVVTSSLSKVSIEPAATPHTVALGAARELVAHGHPDAGRRIADDLAEWLRQRPASEERDSLVATALLAAGRFASAYPLAKRLLAADSANLAYLTLVAVSAAAMNDSAEVWRVSRTLAEMRLPGPEGALRYGQAAIAAALGQPARAVTLLREAMRNGVGIIRGADVFEDDADPFFLSLHGYPPYDDLVKPAG